jgi:molybdenum cofactor biosynthesis protein B
MAVGTGPISVAIVTVSDTRTHETDANAAYLLDQLEKSGNHMARYRIIPDEPAQVLEVLKELSRDRGTQVILFNGGTGFSTRDCTCDVLSKELEKTLPGFGELFRSLSHEQIGSAAMMSRAVCGLYRKRIVFSVPGSPKAVQLAWEKLILPELQHLVWEVSR